MRWDFNRLLEMMDGKEVGRGGEISHSTVT